MVCPLLVLGSLPDRELLEGRNWVSSISRFALSGVVSGTQRVGSAGRRNNACKKPWGGNLWVFLSLRKAIRKETATCYHNVKEEMSRLSSPLLADGPSAVCAAGFPCLCSFPGGRVCIFHVYLWSWLSFRSVSDLLLGAVSSGVLLPSASAWPVTAAALRTLPPSPPAVGAPTAPTSHHPGSRCHGVPCQSPECGWGC